MRLDELEKNIEYLIELPPRPVANIPLWDAHCQALELKQSTVVDPKCLVGVEVEVENLARIDPNTTLVFWRMNEDGSLRNNGHEFVSVPLAASFVNPALTLLFRGLNKGHVFSKRTSVHIHVDFRQVTLDHLFGTLLAYHVVEPLLFKFVGGNRSNNIFCVPWASSYPFQTLNGNSRFATVVENLAPSRYSALNLAALAKFGTLEFRHMPGTNDTKKIMNWLNILLSLRLFGLKHDAHAHILNKIVALNTNSQYAQFVESIFGDLTALLDTRTLLEDMERNVMDVKTSLLNAKFHQEVINKQYSIESELGKTFKFKKPVSKYDLAMESEEAEFRRPPREGAPRPARPEARPRPGARAARIINEAMAQPAPPPEPGAVQRVEIREREQFQLDMERMRIEQERRMLDAQALQNQPAVWRLENGAFGAAIGGLGGAPGAAGDDNFFIADDGGENQPEDGGR